MSFFKRFFARKKTNENIDGMPETHEVTLSKILDVASLVPVEYKHTAKFYEDGFDPLAYERLRLQGLPTDWLMKDKRIPAIKADSRRETEIAKRQYINHLYTVETIIDLQNGMIVHVDDLILRLDEEIAAYDKEIQALRARLDN